MDFLILIHDSWSQCPFFSSMDSNIIDALKEIKSRKISKWYFESIEFYNIEVHDVNRSHYSFDGEILFVFPLVSLGTPSAYGFLMDYMDKMYNRHHWFTTKVTNIQINFGLSFGCLFVHCISIALMIFMNICIMMRVNTTTPNGLDQLCGCCCPWEIKMGV